MHGLDEPITTSEVTLLRKRNKVRDTEHAEEWTLRDTMCILQNCDTVMSMMGCEGWCLPTPGDHRLDNDRGEAGQRGSAAIRFFPPSPLEIFI